MVTVIDLQAGRIRSALLALLVVVTFIGIARPLMELPLPLGRNHNEGWNAHHADAAIHGEALYPPRDALVSNNYPPLSFYVIGALGEIAGDAIVAGRVVSLLSLLLIAVFVGRIARDVTGAFGDGLFAGLLVIATLGTFYQDYVAMNDPQLLGHALQYAGLAVFLRADHSRRGLFLTAALLVLGGTIKHNLVALPLAITFTIYLQRRELLRFWLASSTSLVLVALVALYLGWGSAAFTGIFGHARSFGPHDFALALSRWLMPITPLLAGVVLAIMWRPDDRRVQLLTIVAVTAAITGMLFSFGAGISYNVIFDLVFAACVLAPVAAARKPAALLFLMLPVLLVSPLRLIELTESIESRPRRIAAANEDLAWIATRPGPFLCEDSALSYRVGRDFELGFFNYGQKLATGAVSDRRLLDLMNRRRFALVQLDHPNRESALGASFRQALEQNYELARTSAVNGLFFLPREAPRSAQ